MTVFDRQSVLSPTRLAALRDTLNLAFERRDQIGTEKDPNLTEAVATVLEALDLGILRVAEPQNGNWITHQWIKKAILLSFRLQPTRLIPGAPDSSCWWDKVDLKQAGWDADAYQNAGYRAVPGCLVRHSAYIAANVVLMPSFVNVGAYVDSGTMIDTWATVGSCAQIGRNVHISGGTGIGGVLEPLQANPVIIEDDCFIGARSEVAEGVRVGRGAVLSMGVFIGASTKIVDRRSGDIHYGMVPPYSVVVPGVLPPTEGSAPTAPSLACAVIVKTVDEQTRAKTSINELLRD